MYNKRVIDILKSKDNYISRSDLRDILLSEKESIYSVVIKLYDKLDFDFSDKCYTDEYLFGFYKGQEDMLNMVLLLLFHLKLPDS